VVPNGSEEATQVYRPSSEVGDPSKPIEITNPSPGGGGGGGEEGGGNNNTTTPDLSNAFVVTVDPTGSAGSSPGGELKYSNEDKRQLLQIGEEPSGGEPMVEGPTQAKPTETSTYTINNPEGVPQDYGFKIYLTKIPQEPEGPEGGLPEGPEGGLSNEYTPDAELLQVEEPPGEEPNPETLKTTIGESMEVNWNNYEKGSYLISAIAWSNPSELPESPEAEGNIPEGAIPIEGVSVSVNEGISISGPQDLSTPSSEFYTISLPQGVPEPPEDSFESSIIRPNGELLKDPEGDVFVKEGESFEVPWSAITDEYESEGVYTIKSELFGGIEGSEVIYSETLNVAIGDAELPEGSGVPYTIEQGSGVSSTYKVSYESGGNMTTVEVGTSDTINIPSGETKLYITGDYEHPKFGDKIVSIEQWGNITFESFENSFEKDPAPAPELSSEYNNGGRTLISNSVSSPTLVQEGLVPDGSNSLQINAEDSPDLSNVESMSGMFQNVQLGNADLSNWDTSNVRDMSKMFKGSNFNGDVSGWDTGSVTNMSEMFSSRREFGSSVVFNQDISSWDTSNVEDMSKMFKNNRQFDQDLSSWNTGSVTNMSKMFDGANNFNGDVSGWDTSSVTDMHWMFRDAENFNQDLNNWDTSSVTDMSYMFLDAENFNQDLNNWDTSSVTDISKMFYDASNFNGDVSGWDTGSVTNMNEVFYDANNFNGDVSAWDVSNVENMQGMFSYAKSFNQDLSSWDTSSVTNMRGMFKGASNFNGDVSGWDTSSVTDMSRMFNSAGSFNQDLNNWDTSSVTDMHWMFYDADQFNGDISSWNTGSVTDMSRMFMDGDKDGYAFNQDISGWDTSSVTTMENMFRGSRSFNQPLNSWDVSNVQNMKDMFRRATSFNQDLDNWDTSSVTTMRRMFINAVDFQGNVSTWDVSNVNNMRNMFDADSIVSYTPDLSSWCVPNIDSTPDGFWNTNSAPNDHYPKWGESC
jgi:surface protein